MSVLEIRTYRVLAGRTDELVALMVARAVPLLRAAGIDVVACEASRDPGDGDPRDACLIRAFADRAARERAEATFYASAAWREGPRDEVLALIETFHTVVLDTPETAIDALRRPIG